MWMDGWIVGLGTSPSVAWGFVLLKIGIRIYFFCSFVVYLISEREGGECCYAVLCCAVLYYGITYYSTQHNTHISDSQSPFLSDFQISDSDICVCVFFFLVLRFQIDKQAKKEHARRGEKAREKDKEAKSKMENGKMVKW